TSVLGASMSVLGLIEGMAESTASILKGLSGWFSDKMGKRRPFVVWGYSLSAFSKPLLFLAYSWPLVLVSRFLDRAGKGLRTSARDAMITDSTEPEYRGKAFGFHRSMDTVGACIGPLIALFFLMALKDNIRTVFLIAFIPAALAVLTLTFFLKDAPLKRLNDKDGLRFDLRIFSPNFKRFLLATAIFAIGNSSDAFLIMRARGLGLSVTMVVLAYVVYNISYAGLSMPFGALSDRMPRKYVMMMGYAVFAVVYVGFAAITGPGMVWPLFFIYGFYIAMTDGVGKALVSDMVPKEYMGTAMGLYHFILGIFAFFASLIAGLLWTHIGVTAPFYYGAIMSVISFVMFASIKNN
ncbi:MAG: MFS transporter, partial [Candidatus Omnitrophica bacterium]|nr:MFS transporter [Candidatus Omnitrophota bacterium]